MRDEQIKAWYYIHIYIMYPTWWQMHNIQRVGLEFHGTYGILIHRRRRQSTAGPIVFAILAISLRRLGGHYKAAYFNIYSTSSSLQIRFPYNNHKRKCIFTKPSSALLCLVILQFVKKKIKIKGVIIFLKSIDYNFLEENRSYSLTHTIIHETSIVNCL